MSGEKLPPVFNQPNSFEQKPTSKTSTSPYASPFSSTLSPHSLQPCTLPEGHLLFEDEHPETLAPDYFVPAQDTPNLEVF